MGQSLEGARADNLAEVIDSYPLVHPTATIILGAFTFRSWKSPDPVLTALDVLHQLYTSEQRKLPAAVPTAFLTPAWRKLIGIGPTIDRRTWEVAVVVALGRSGLPSRCDPRSAVYRSGARAILPHPMGSLSGPAATARLAPITTPTTGRSQAQSSTPRSPTDLRRSTPRSLRLTLASQPTCWMASFTMKAPSSWLRDVAHLNPWPTSNQRVLPRSTDLGSRDRLRIGNGLVRPDGHLRMSPRWLPAISPRTNP
jgi:hypothetical protein